MWTQSSDDRAFLRELSREIVAAVAAMALNDFDTLSGLYFANPNSPRPRRWPATPAANQSPGSVPLRA